MPAPTIYFCYLYHTRTTYFSCTGERGGTLPLLPGYHLTLLPASCLPCLPTPAFWNTCSPTCHRLRLQAWSLGELPALWWGGGPGRSLSGLPAAGVTGYTGRRYYTGLLPCLNHFPTFSSAYYPGGQTFSCLLLCYLLPTYWLPVRCGGRGGHRLLPCPPPCHLPCLPLPTRQVPSSAPGGGWVLYITCLSTGRCLHTSSAERQKEYLPPFTTTWRPASSHTFPYRWDLSASTFFTAPACCLLHFFPEHP